MKIEILADADSVASKAARLIAARARTAVAERGRFLLAVSGGRTPWKMLRALAAEAMPWDGVHILQVDERIAPTGHPDRNLTQLRDSLGAQLPVRPDRLHPMPVEDADLEAAAERYAAMLSGIAGSPPVLDLVHLGLGADGHTASLVPGDPVLDIADRDIALTGVYQGRRRMTMTFPLLDRARTVLWLVTGADKAGALAKLRNADRSIPAGRVDGSRALIIADAAAAETT
jgi:6-phosphogluconolactonase